MAETITCPHCKGPGATYVIGQKDGKPALEPVTCVICDGKGYVPAPPPPQPVAPPPPPPVTPPPAEFWPILVPLMIFSLFFLFLFF